MQHKLNNSIGAWTTSDSGVDNNERIINHISNYNYYLMEILMVGKSVTRQNDNLSFMTRWQSKIRDTFPNPIHEPISNHPNSTN